MKIIDLLVKASKGEELPKYIKYNDRVYKRKWDNYVGDEPIDELYVTSDEHGNWFDSLDVTLDSKIEIPMEYFKIIKIDTQFFDDEKYTPEERLNVCMNFINELVDEVNKLKEAKQNESMD